MKNKILILLCMVPMIAETAEYNHRYSGNSTVDIGKLVADSQQSATAASSRFTNIKSTVANAWNKTVGRGVNFVGTKCSEGVESVKGAGNALYAGTQEEFGKATDASVKTKAMSFATAANNNRKSSAIVTGAALAAGFVMYKTAQATAQAVQWLRVKRAMSIVAGVKTIADTKTASVINAVNFLYNSRFSKDDITNLMTNVTEDHAINKVQRIVELIPSKRASKPSVTLVSRVKAAASNVWNKVPSFRKA